MHLNVSTQAPDCSVLLTKPPHAETRFSFLVGKPIRHALVPQVSADDFREVPLAASEPITHSVSALATRQFLNFHVFSPH